MYSLPLEGAVPREWDSARLVAESAVARDLWTRLLLGARRLALAPSPEAKEPILLEMMGLHLELGEYEAAIYYADNRLVSDDARRFGHVIGELARHRRADLALIRGETSAQYIESERARAHAVRQQMPNAPLPLAQLSWLVISEIEDDIGDKAAALATFQKLDLAQIELPILAALAGRRAERLYRLYADRERLLDTYRVLSALPKLSMAGRLEYAERFVTELARGRTRAAQVDAITAAQAQVDASSELGLRLAVEKILSNLDDARQETVRAELFELYKQNKDVDRRRALVLSTLSAAARAGNEYVQYQFVTSWVSSLDRRNPERKYAEELYDDIVLDRAYGEGRQGRPDESRGYFYGATARHRFARGAHRLHRGAHRRGRPQRPERRRPEEHRRGVREALRARPRQPRVRLRQGLPHRARAAPRGGHGSSRAGREPGDRAARAGRRRAAEAGSGASALGLRVASTRPPRRLARGRRGREPPVPASPRSGAG